MTTTHIIILLLLISAVCGADDALRDAELARKQAEVALASSNIWLKLRWGIGDWLPWILGASLLFVIWKWLLKRCPQCNRRFPRQISGSVVHRSTSTQSGLAILTYRCRGCGHEWEHEQYLSRFRPRLTGGRSGSSSSGSKSSRPGGFSGFGGGSSGGGGSTRDY